MRIADVFAWYRLWRDLRFVGGFVTGIACGFGIGYILGWDQTLGLKPTFLILPVLLVMAAGEEIAVRADRRRRQMDEDKPRHT
jgi:F0F1-type ATP synthase assembly protein I